MKAIYLHFIVPAFIIVPIVMALIRRAYWGRPERAVLLYLLLSAVSNCVASYLSMQHITNLPVLHVYTVLEFFTISYFFLVCSSSKTEQTIIQALWVAMPLLTLANMLYLNSIYKYNLIPRSVSAIIVLVLCINFMMRSLNFSASKVPFFNFAVVVGLLLYFSGSLTLFALSDFIINNKAINMLIWNTHGTFVLIMYLIIAVAYYKTGTEK